MYTPCKTVLSVFITFLVTAANAHSWVEELTAIAPNGTFVGSPGYARGNVFRTAPGFSDTNMTWLSPQDGGTNLSTSDRMCKQSQRKQVQTKGSPRLQVSAGGAIALRYQENGHVTLPWNQPGKPKNRGTIYVYGTTQPKEDEKLLDVHHSWNRAGTGGDRRGVLLTKQNFDDSRCYQINSGNISEARQAKYPHVANQLMGADMWCQTDAALPANATAGKLYTLYWVWDWPTAPDVDPSLPNGKAEVYSTCIDVDVVDNQAVSKMRVKSGYIEGQPLDSASIPEQFAEIVKSDSSKDSSVEESSPDSASSSSSSTMLATTSTIGHMLSKPTGITSFVTIVKTVYPSNCKGIPTSSVDP